MLKVSPSRVLHPSRHGEGPTFTRELEGGPVRPYPSLSSPVVTIEFIRAKWFATCYRNAVNLLMCVIGLHKHQCNCDTPPSHPSPLNNVVEGPTEDAVTD
ncbi:hypothetical protein J6590_052780 [Homalodisca vitripennis]|nr:hypothetical protein J6590_052780 [Homalodisca vitripennis]